MDGIECVRQLREWEKHHPSHSRLYTIAYTANGEDPGVHELCMASGFDVVVNKPISLAKLVPLLLKH